MCDYNLIIDGIERVVREIIKFGVIYGEIRGFYFLEIRTLGGGIIR